MRISTEVRRQQLIAAAVVVLKRDGVANASLRAIAAEAGASLAAVHVCFANKDELIAGAVEGFLEQGWLQVPEASKALGGVRAALYQVLDGFWMAIAFDSMWAVSQFEVGMWSLRERQHHGIIRQIYEKYEDRIVDIIQASAADADEVLALPSSVIARALLAICDGIGLQYLADPMSSSHREVATMLVDSLAARALRSP